MYVSVLKLVGDTSWFVWDIITHQWKLSEAFLSLTVPLNWILYSSSNSGLQQLLQEIGQITLSGIIFTKMKNAMLQSTFEASFYNGHWFLFTFIAKIPFVGLPRLDMSLIIIHACSYSPPHTTFSVKNLSILVLPGTIDSSTSWIQITHLLTKDAVWIVMGIETIICTFRVSPEMNLPWTISSPTQIFIGHWR